MHGANGIYHKNLQIQHLDTFVIASVGQML